MSAFKRKLSQWVSIEFIVMQWLIVAGFSVYIARSLYSQAGVIPTTIAVILAMFAYTFFITWRQIRAQRAVAWNTKGFEILKRNHYGDALENEEALAYFDKALKLDPQSMRAWFGKSVVFVRMGRFTESIEICGRILALYPHDVTVLTFKGRALLLLRRFDEARAVLESALRIDAKNAETLNLMVITLIRLRRYDDALDNAIYALTLFPKDPRFWHYQASLLCDDLHRYDEALAACDEAISRDVTLPNLWAIKGDALRALGQEPEAIANYSHVLSLPCSEFFGWSARGRALMGLRRYEEALTAYEQALAIQTITPMTWRKKAEVLRALGREVEAQEADQRAEDLE